MLLKPELTNGMSMVGIIEFGQHFLVETHSAATRDGNGDLPLCGVPGSANASTCLAIKSRGTAISSF